MLGESPLARKEKMLRWLGWAFLFAVPFGTKKYLGTLGLAFTSQYVTEYSSAFLYATDLFSVALTLVVLGAAPRIFFATLRRAWAVLVVLAVGVGSLMFAAHTAIGAYSLARLAVAFLALFAVASLVRGRYLTVRVALSAFAASAAFQSVMGLLQFARGRSVGLWFLGESAVFDTTKGVARVFLEGERYLRAYGTVPHANILAAFLVAGLVGACVWFVLAVTERRLLRAILAGMGVLLIAAGLVVTFSRSGWIVALIALFGTAIAGFATPSARRGTLWLAALIAVTAGALWVSLGWAIVPRAGFTSSEPSVSHRFLYNEIGFETVVDHPLGVGIGNQIVESVSEERYQSRGLGNWWEWQPVHNLYLLVAAELGIPGLAVLLLTLFWLFAARKEADDPFPARATTVLFVAFLVFGLFDHFFWDLQAGRLLFWATAALLLGALARPAPSRVSVAPHSTVR